MKIKAWLFLIGKNRQLGYRPVVIPDILIAANIPGRLDEFRGNQIIEEPICKVVDIKEIGVVTIIYRIVYMTNGGNIYTDLQNRPVLWSEGLLIQGNYPDIKLPPGAFQYFHKQFAEYAKKFYLDEQNANHIKSPMLEIQITTEQLQETIKRLKRIVADLKVQEQNVSNQIATIDRKAQTGKTVTIIGIPLILVIVGLVVIPVGLYISKLANDERKDPESLLKGLRKEIEKLETEIRKLEMGGLENNS